MDLNAVAKEKETLERENLDLRRSLKVESKERDELEQENHTLERKAKNLEKKVAQLEQDLKAESKERDLLDSVNASLDRESRNKDSQIKNLKLQVNLLEEEVTRLKDSKSKLQKKNDELQQEQERELDKLREELRQVKREMREKTRKFETDKETLERELKRSSSNKKQDIQISSLEKELKFAQDKIRALQTTGSKGSDSAVADVLEEKAKVEREKGKLEEKISKLTSKIEELTKEKEEFEEELKSEKKRTEQEKKLRELADKLKNDIDEEFLAFKKQMKENAEKTGDYEEAQQNLIKLGNKFKELEQENEELLQELANLKVELTEEEEYSKELEEIKDSLQNELDQIKQQSVTVTSTTAPDDLVQEVKNLKEQLEEEKRKSNIAKEASNGTSEQISVLSATKAELEKKVQQMTDMLKTSSDNSNKLQTEKETLQKRIKEFEDNLSSEQAVNEKLEKEKRSLTAHVTSLQSQVEDLSKKLNETQESERKLARTSFDYTLTIESEVKEKTKLKQIIENLEAENNNLKRNVEVLNEMEKEKLNLETQLIDLRSKIDEEVAAKQTLQQEVNGLKSKVQHTEAEVKKEVDKDRLNLQQQLKDAQEEQRKLERNGKRLEEQVQLLNGELSKERQSISTLEESNKKLAQDKKKSEVELEKEVSLREKESQDKKKLEHDLEDLSKQTEELKKQKSQLEKERKESIERSEVLLSEKTDIETARQKLEKEIKELKQSLESKQTVEEQNKSIKQELDSLKKQLQESQNASLTVVPSTNEEALRSENEKLKKELEDLRKSMSTEEANTSSGENNYGAGKLVGPRRAAPSRVRRTGTSGVAANMPKLNAEAMGGVALFGGLNVNAEMLKSATTKKVESQESKSRLYCLKGRRRVRIFQVELSCQSLNKGDVFVLDTPTKIYQWNGSECNRLERTKGKDITSRLLRQRASFGPKVDVVVLDEDDKDDENMSSFFKELGGKTDIAPASAGGDDLEVENYLDSISKLYKIAETGDLEEMSSKQLVMELLDSNGCYVLDCKNEVYIWIGKGSSKELRAIAPPKAQELLEVGDRAPWAEVQRMAEGGESPVFQEKFTNWPDGATLGPQRFYSNVAQSKKQEKIDVEKMHSAEPPISSVRDPDDGSGKMEIWIVNDAIKEEQPKELYGKFWTENNYLVLYSYGSGTDPSYIIYFWLGKESHKNEKGTTAALALNLSKRYRGSTQIRVVQGKEPRHFLKIFHGKFIVHKGSQRSELSENGLFEVKGNEESNTSTFEVERSATSLNSNFTFFLSGPNPILWVGKYTSDFSKKVAEELSTTLSTTSNVQLINEGSENDNFWSLLGGKQSYYSEKAVTNKLFLFSSATGVVTADPLWIWSQDDLVSDSVLLLDTVKSVFLWVGSRARENEKKIALETAQDYIKQAPPTHDRSAIVLVVQEGNEPLDFVAQFHGWSKSADHLVKATATDISKALGEYTSTKSFTYEELKDKRDKLPKNLDFTQLENYLSDEDFQKLFNMDKLAWSKVPKWKQGPIKKQLGLF